MRSLGYTGDVFRLFNILDGVGLPDDEVSGFWVEVQALRFRVQGFG